MDDIERDRYVRMVGCWPFRYHALGMCMAPFAHRRDSSSKGMMS
ncbi:hypothetical protein HMPREF1316_0934 [Olsenella profusa F0195]|uniref:Uncharacterized protein n=1 Tax=Olsenella profusa F0195 TaxID=1125712 RepID=U2TKJ7_9ACTN|nr:hypothetical protein HMPREF1316_0934 [Olsenella profusa F0195]